MNIPRWREPSVALFGNRFQAWLNSGWRARDCWYFYEKDVFQYTTKDMYIRHFSRFGRLMIQWHAQHLVCGE